MKAPLDLVALRARIAEKAAKNIHVAPVVLELIEELEYARGERAAVVAWLREAHRWLDVEAPLLLLAREIERGEHRRESDG